MNLRPVLLATAIVTLTTCADTADESLVRVPAVPSTSPPPSEHLADREPRAVVRARGSPIGRTPRPHRRLRFDPHGTDHPLHRDESPPKPGLRDQPHPEKRRTRRHNANDISSHHVQTASSRSASAFRYRSSSCVVPRSMPLPPPLATRLEPGSTLSDTIHVQLPLRVQHPECASASEHLPPLSRPPYSLSFCLGFASSADPTPQEVDGETLFGGMPTGPETLACSVPIDLR